MVASTDPHLRLAPRDSSAPVSASQRSALAAIARTLTPKLQRFFTHFTESESTGSELAQETLVRAFVNLDSFRGDAQLSTWVWSIARNLLKEHYRARRSAAEHIGHELVDPDTLTSAPAPHLSDQGDCVRRGFRAFAKDHPERAEAVYLAYIEGWTREELAEHLGRSPHATTEFLSQCKQKLRPYVEECDGC